MKVLMIDDDPDIFEVVSAGFELGWLDAQVFGASDGATGLFLTRMEDPDVVLLDIGLPDMSGFSVLEQIRRTSDVPVVMLTVRGSDADIVRALDLGADDYIVKPFSQLVMLARVQAVFRRSALGSRENRTGGTVLPPGLSWNLP